MTNTCWDCPKDKEGKKRPLEPDEKFRSGGLILCKKHASVRSAYFRTKKVGGKKIKKDDKNANERKGFQKR